MKRVVFALTLATFGAAGCADETVPERAAPAGDAADLVCVPGRFTDEGVECPAFRGDDGTLYTLTGDLGDSRPGERACVCGTGAEMSFCMQGRTLAVRSVEARCP